MGCHDGTHLGDHLGGCVRRGGTRPGLGGHERFGHGDSAGLQELGPFNEFRFSGLTEGLVAVVFVEEIIISGREILAGLAARLLCGVPIAGRTVGVLLACSAQVGSEVAQARRNVGNSGAGSQEDGVGQQQDEEGTGSPGGHKEYEGARNEPADNTTGRVDARLGTHAGVTARDVHKSGESHRNTDTASHVVGQRGAARARGDKLAGERHEEQGENDGEDSDKSRRSVVDGVPSLTGNLEPFAQSNDDRGGKSDEGRGVALDLGVRRFPPAHHAGSGTSNGREQAGQQTGLGGLLWRHRLALGGRTRLARLGARARRTFTRGRAWRRLCHDCSTISPALAPLRRRAASAQRRIFVTTPVSSTLSTCSRVGTGKADS